MPHPATFVAILGAADQLADANYQVRFGTPRPGTLVAERRC
jgi:hypothetical protein